MKAPATFTSVEPGRHQDGLETAGYFITAMLHIKPDLIMTDQVLSLANHAFLQEPGGPALINDDMLLAVCRNINMNAPPPQNLRAVLNQTWQTDALTDTNVLICKHDNTLNIPAAQNKAIQMMTVPSDDRRNWSNDRAHEMVRLLYKLRDGQVWHLF